jgi:hypothetical protein
MCWPICLIEGSAFPLHLCVRGRLLRLDMLSHSVYGHLLFQLCMGLLSNGEEACYYSHRWWGLFGRRISRWNASTSLLCVEVAVGENYSSSGR